MTSITVLRDENGTDTGPRFTAVTNTGKLQSIGKTMGEAIDALIAKLPDDQASEIVIVVQPRPETAFNKDQVTRLRRLIVAAKISPLSSDDQAEMEALIDAEFKASAQFASTVASALGR
jgi:hypothetical protein